MLRRRSKSPSFAPIELDPQEADALNSILPDDQTITDKRIDGRPGFPISTLQEELESFKEIVLDMIQKLRDEPR